MTPCSSNSRYETFRRELVSCLEAKRGRKADLARYLDVVPAQLYEWISGKVTPGAEPLLGMQAWLAGQRTAGRKTKKSPS
ncbi:MAG: hypothetical protein LBK99_18745 [Opitutaceae bacterium]|jgi:transposase-like protein|nr:hypothetical protein [Opitutaceae bacterium]